MAWKVDAIEQIQLRIQHRVGRPIFDFHTVDDRPSRVSWWWLPGRPGQPPRKPPQTSSSTAKKAANHARKSLAPRVSRNSPPNNANSRWSTVSRDLRGEPPQAGWVEFIALGNAPDRRVRRARRRVRRPLLPVGRNQRIGYTWRRGEHPTQLVARRGVHERRGSAERNYPLICVRWGPVRKLDSCCQGRLNG